MRLSAILVLAAEAYMVWMVVLRLLRPGTNTSPVFWAATAAQVGLGLITNMTYHRYFTAKNYKLRHFSIVGLMLIGMGVPFALYYSNLDFLKPAASTWAVYLLTVNTYWVYRVLTKQPLSRADLPVSRFLMPAQIIHGIFLAAVAISMPVLAVLPLLGSVPLLGKNSDRTIIEIVLGIMSVLILLVAWYLLRLVGLVMKGDKPDVAVYFIWTLRTSLFMAVAVYGFLLGLFGSGWYLWLPMMMAAGAALVVTFPIKKRWSEWKAPARKRQ